MRRLFAIALVASIAALSVALAGSSEEDEVYDSDIVMSDMPLTFYAGLQ